MSKWWYKFWSELGALRREHINNNKRLIVWFYHDHCPTVQKTCVKWFVLHCLLALSFLLEHRLDTSASISIASFWQLWFKLRSYIASWILHFTCVLFSFKRALDAALSKGSDDAPSGSLGHLKLSCSFIYIIKNKSGSKFNQSSNWTELVLQVSNENVNIRTLALALTEVPWALASVPPSNELSIILGLTLSSR